MEQNTTARLTEVLLSAEPENLEEYLKEHAEKLYDKERPFAAYIRPLLKKKGITQQSLFLAADIPERYGYKLISGEKHTVKRDVVLRLCIGGKFTLDEAQSALKLYGFAPLYPRIPRDAALIIALNKAVGNVHEANHILESHGLEPLETCGEQ